MEKIRKEEIPLEGTIVLIQDTSFATMQAFDLDKKFFSEIKTLEEKSEKTKIIFMNNFVNDDNYYDKIIYLLDIIPKEVKIILITSSRFYGYGKQPGHIIKKFKKRKDFVSVVRSEGVPFKKITDSQWKISKQPGQLEKLFSELGLLNK